MIEASLVREATETFKENLNEEYEETLIIVEHLIRIASTRGFFEIEFNLNKDTEDNNRRLIKYLESKNYQVDRIWKKSITITWQFAKKLPKDSFINCNKYLKQSYEGLPLDTQ